MTYIHTLDDDHHLSYLPTYVSEQDLSILRSHPTFTFTYLPTYLRLPTYLSTYLPTSTCTSSLPGRSTASSIRSFRFVIPCEHTYIHTYIHTHTCIHTSHTKVRAISKYGSRTCLPTYLPTYLPMMSTLPRALTPSILLSSWFTTVSL